jgi:hypothetical protein
MNGLSFLGGFTFSGTAFHFRGMLRFSRIFRTIDCIAIVTELSDCLADTATLIEGRKEYISDAFISKIHRYDSIF